MMRYQSIPACRCTDGQRVK